MFRAKIVDVGRNTLTIEATGADDKLAGDGGPAPHLRHQGTGTHGKDRAVSRPSRRRLKIETRRHHPAPDTHLYRKERHQPWLHIFYERDTDIELLKARKIAVIGYGSQGTRTR